MPNGVKQNVIRQGWDLNPNFPKETGCLVCIIKSALDVLKTQDRRVTGLRHLGIDI